MSEKCCGNCLYCNSMNYCIPKSSSVSPMRKGCDSWLPKDKPSANDDIANPLSENKDQKSEITKLPAKRKSRKGIGGRKGKPIDIKKLKREYNTGKTLRALGDMFGLKESGIHYRVDQLIKSGELMKRNQTTKQSTNEVTKLTTPLEVLSVPNEQSSENKICSQCGQDVRHSKDYYEFKRKYESLPDEKRHEVYRYLQFLQFNQKGD